MIADFTMAAGRRFKSSILRMRFADFILQGMGIQSVSFEWSDPKDWFQLMMICKNLLAMLKYYFFDRVNEIPNG